MQLAEFYGKSPDFIKKNFILLYSKQKSRQKFINLVARRRFPDVKDLCKHLTGDFNMAEEPTIDELKKNGKLAKIYRHIYAEDIITAFGFASYSDNKKIKRDDILKNLEGKQHLWSKERIERYQILFSDRIDRGKYDSLKSKLEMFNSILEDLRSKSEQGI